MKRAKNTLCKLPTKVAHPNVDVTGSASCVENLPLLVTDVLGARRITNRLAAVKQWSFEADMVTLWE